MLIRDLFDIYMRYGGMPGIADVGWEQERVLPLLEGIYSTVVIRDILERERRRGQRQLTDAILLEKIMRFLAGNIGSNISATSIGNTLVSEAEEKLYIQVTESMESEDVRKRELTPLMKIPDNYEKIVLSLQPGLDTSYEGIRSLNLIDWLIERL